ncbi:tryptophan 7-halogenase [Pseudomonas sp. PS01297]|uniref:NAD(P)/FAD-dependent oxidoreductase n=1 Tax=Pseudomonas sp. PS01297 TaxID=2991433 RepID=UPI00249A0B18|nr:tryptophan 7-halogenase [Pseudomonas sp. PS01297]
MADRDVVIVGAGPAGTAAAILCAQRGLRVTLLEQAVFPRARPGETLPPGVEAVLAQLGIAQAINQAGFLRHPGHAVKWAGERLFSAFGESASGPELGYQIPRETLDSVLLDRATELGVEVLQPCRVQGVLRERQQVCGVSTAQGDRLAAWVIDASGGNGWLSRHLGLPWRTYSPRLLAHYGYATGNCPEGAEVCGIEADPFGWYWMAKIRSDFYHWTRLCFTHAGTHQAVPPAVFKPLLASGPVRGADVTWRLCQQACGDGFFIAGDSAFVLDPSSGHGVVKALMTGMMAAHAVVESLSTPWHVLSIQQQYQYWINDWFNRDRLKMSEFYRTHPFAPEWCG